MISPDFKNTVPIDYKGPAQKFIEANHGTELWLSLQPSIIELEDIQKELTHAMIYKCDVEQLHKFKDLFAKNYCNSMLLNKYFSFGNGNKQMNLKFVWFDSFSQDRVESYSPVFAALSSKFNYGVCLSRIACYMPLDGDGIKHACKYMQNAAWIFEDLKQNVSQLKPGETSPDFTAESLDMLSNLMLA